MNLSSQMATHANLVPTLSLSLSPRALGVWGRERERERSWECGFWQPLKTVKCHWIILPEGSNMPKAEDIWNTKLIAPLLNLTAVSYNFKN